ncbi:Pentatricopeptide repeat-containing protein At1g20230 [Linum perenne]
MEARKVFDKIPQPNVVACSALLSGYARKGRVDETKELLCKATELGLQLNLVSWNGMITGFNHSRQYSDAVLMFRNMHSEGFKPDGTSISSVLPAVRGVEMLCWGIQIHGCIIKQGLGQDNWVVSSLVDMYGKCARPKDMSKVCEEMRDMDVISWTSMIASCSQNGKDMEALELFREMQMEGIKPNSVTIPCLLPACGNIAALMHDVEEHDKEEMLCDHSEKLAVALGLVNTSSGFPLQVIKNLRICGDCHVVIKFISSFEKREIFVRDTNLFHHFKDGTCSCGDYW